MIIGLRIACAALFCLAAGFVILYLRWKRNCARLATELKRFRDIAEIEKYANDQRAKAEAALAEVARSEAALQQLSGRINEQKAAIASQESQIEAQQSQ